MAWSGVKPAIALLCRRGCSGAWSGGCVHESDTSNGATPLGYGPALVVQSVGETVDFHGVQGTWVASMSPELLEGMRNGVFVPAEGHRENKYLYQKGRRVYLLHSPDGKTWVMLSYTTEVDTDLSLDQLLGTPVSKLKLPDGFKFEIKELPRDLTIDSQRANSLAHIIPGQPPRYIPGLWFRQRLQLHPLTSLMQFRPNRPHSAYNLEGHSGAEHCESEAAHHCTRPSRATPRKRGCKTPDACTGGQRPQSDSEGCFTRYCCA